MELHDVAIIASLCTLVTFLMTLWISTSRFKQKVFEDVVKDIKGKFGALFMTKETYDKDNTKTCNRLDGIQKELTKGNKEFTVLRLILSEAKLLPQERIDAIRNAVMNGDHT